MGIKRGGRHSAASQAVAVLGKVVSLQRPDAPYDLNDEQSKEWWAIVNRMPADWFPRETHGMLAQLCRMIVRARNIAQIINQMEEAGSFNIKDYRDLTRSESAISSAICSLSTKMRLSQQSSYDRTKRKPLVTLEKQPWESDNEDGDD